MEYFYSVLQPFLLFTTEFVISLFYNELPQKNRIVPVLRRLTNYTIASQAYPKQSTSQLLLVS